ncbi:MAG: hypothetical protein M5T61_17650 [Acidimicrobiia bacterium]|nr:hypothetical protein [Acidimicrobiia bacterium]
MRGIDEAGSVPELAVENPLDARVLLYDGEELVGAKQNRILNASVLVEAKSTLTIPVSCVERGRWSRRSEHLVAGTHVSHRELLTAQGGGAGRPPARPRRRPVGGGTPSTSRRRMSVDSPTGASSDLYDAHRRDLRALEDAFPAQPGQCGAILGLGDDLCVDLVSRPDAFERLWPKLRAGYLLDALERLGRSRRRSPPCPRVPRPGRGRRALDAAVGRARRRSPASRRARDRLRPRARRRARPALHVHEPPRRTACAGPDRAPQREAVSVRVVA